MRSLIVNIEGNPERGPL